MQIVHGVRVALYNHYNATWTTAIEMPLISTYRRPNNVAKGTKQRTGFSFMFYEGRQLDLVNSISLEPKAKRLS
jgi:hypothetical protein